MTASEFVPVAAAIVAIIGAAAAFWTNRRKPRLDANQAEQVSAQVKKTNAELNRDRDLRVLDLELWGDAMRPVIRAIQIRDDQLVGALTVAYERLGWQMPTISPFPGIPRFPEPRPVPPPPKPA